MCVHLCGGGVGVSERALLPGHKQPAEICHPALFVLRMLKLSLTSPTSSPAAERPSNVMRFILDEHNNVQLVNQR